VTKYPNQKDLDINKSTTEKPFGKRRMEVGYAKSDAKSTPKQKLEERQRPRRRKEAG